MGGGDSKRPGGDHWTDVYRTDPLRVYEIEAPIFESPELTTQELGLMEELARRVGTTIESPILDLACGPARHGRRLAQDGHEVVSIDLSAGLLRIAALRAAEGGRSRRPMLICADIHHLPVASGSFASVLILGKSFGYVSDRHDRSILADAFAMLRPGGFLGLELPDREPYLASVKPLEREQRERANGDTLHSEYRSHWQAESRRLEVHESHVLGATGEIFWQGEWDVRLYESNEIAALVGSAGFARVTVDRKSLVEVLGAKGDVLIVGAVKPGRP